VRPTWAGAAVLQAAAEIGGDITAVRAEAPGVFLVEPPPDLRPNNVGLAEVYWNDIARGPMKDLYTLEEAKTWARTVVERVRALAEHKRAGRGGRGPDANCPLISSVIDGVRILIGVGAVGLALFLFLRLGWGIGHFNDYQALKQELAR
jgi:hypothetical protein